MVRVRLKSAFTGSLKCSVQLREPRTLQSKVRPETRTFLRVYKCKRLRNCRPDLYNRNIQDEVAVEFWAVTKNKRASLTVQWTQRVCSLFKTGHHRGAPLRNENQVRMMSELVSIFGSATVQKNRLERAKANKAGPFQSLIIPQLFVK